MLNILSLGAGVQSSYIYLTQDLDYAIFADTQDEPLPVYRHLAWLRGLGRAPIITKTKGKLSEHLRRGVNSTGQRFASIPCYTATAIPQKEGRVRRQCTREYKTEVVERAIRRDVLGMQPRQRIKKGTTITMLFGISADEARRAGRIIERLKSKPWIAPRFPLIERCVTRADCIHWLKENVPHPVPRSACVYCPNHSDQEWLDMQLNDQDAWTVAVDIDEALRKPGNVVNRKMDFQMFLHRSLKPLKMIDFQARIDARLPDIPLFAIRECEGMCGT